MSDDAFEFEDCQKENHQVGIICFSGPSCECERNEMSYPLKGISACKR
jgi:hypothetical protein